MVPSFAIYGADDHRSEGRLSLALALERGRSGVTLWCTFLEVYPAWLQLYVLPELCFPIDPQALELDTYTECKAFFYDIFKHRKKIKWRPAAQQPRCRALWSYLMELFGTHKISKQMP